MEKDWKADLLLVQKLMGPQRIGRKENIRLGYDRKDLFGSFLSENQKLKIKKQRKKNNKETVAGTLCSWTRPEECYLSQ